MANEALNLYYHLCNDTWKLIKSHFGTSEDLEDWKEVHAAAAALVDKYQQNPMAQSFAAAVLCELKRRSQEKEK